MDEELQFVMSQIDISSEKESGTKKRKTEVPTYDFQTPPNMSPQRSKFLFETSRHKWFSMQSSYAQIRRNEKKYSRSTGLSTPRSTQSSRIEKAKQSPDKSPSGEYDACQYASLRPGTSSSTSLEFTSDGDVSLSPPELKGTLALKTSFMSKNRAEKSEERSLIKKRVLAIRPEKKLHFSKSSSDSNKKRPTASIIPSKTKIATRIEDTAGIRSPEPIEGRDEPPVHKTYTIPHTYKEIFLDVVEQGQDSMWMYFMKFLSPTDLLIILTSNKGLFPSKVSYQLVMELSRRAFPKCA
jgi:hypothetical protein